MNIFLGVLIFIVIVITINAVTADMEGLSDRMKRANINALWIPVLLCIGAGIYYLIKEELFWGIFLIICSLGWIKYINVLKKEHNLK
jgi:hypothetical protein